MTPQLVVDTASAVPPYEQVREQLAGLIRYGALRPGQRLPSVRQLAADLGLAVGTVARAYRELELAGQVRSRRGAGTRVADAVDPDTPYPRNSARDERPRSDARSTLDARTTLDVQARAYVAAARHLGVPGPQIVAAVRRAVGTASI